MSQLETTTELPEPTDVRFSMLSMLVITAVIAVVATALGAFLRRFPAEAQVRLWVYWGILVALLAGIALFNACLRYVAEKKAGRVLFQLVPHSYFFPRAPRLASILIGTFLVASAPAMWVGGSFFVAKPNASEWMQALNWGTFYGLFGSGLGIAYFWWHKRIRLCENGVVIRHNFAPWQDLKQYYWDAVYRDVVVMQFLRQKTAIRVPPEMRDAVAALLKPKLHDESEEQPTAAAIGPYS
jgi:hypothetical protein